MRVCACVCMCVRVWGGARAPAPPPPRPRPGQAGIFPPSRMGDAESCLLRQQTREVRKKPLINYRFLRAAASAELRVLAAAQLAGRRRVPRTASSEAEPSLEGAPSADPAGQRSSRLAALGERNRAQPSAAPRPPQVPREREPGARSPLPIPVPQLAPTSSPPRDPVPAPLSPPRDGRRVARSVPPRGCYCFSGEGARASRAGDRCVCLCVSVLVSRSHWGSTCISVCVCVFLRVAVSPCSQQHALVCPNVCLLFCDLGCACVCSGVCL